MTEKKRIGIMISGSGTNMQAIVRACKSGQINAEVAFVGADNHGAKGLLWAVDAGIPTFVIDYAAMPPFIFDDLGEQVMYDNFWTPSEEGLKKVYEKSTFIHSWFDGNYSKQVNCIHKKMIAEYYILAKAREYNIDLMALAGFMQVNTSFLIDGMNKGSYDPRIMNIHPALLPAFPGVDGYGDTIRYGCKVGGCTVHFVDYGEDTGPIIGQRAISVLPNSDIDSFKKRGLQEEYELFPECIQLFVENRLRLETVKQNNGLERKIVKIIQED
ncbi:MAG: phosphoribosylglycinamide formyltransferase [Candidatus Moraniibacteriota bacterium]|jgi:phosphoribosylglycinamide formyltransferase 1